MLKQMKKTLGILLAVCFLMSVTAAAVSAGPVMVKEKKTAVVALKDVKTKFFKHNHHSKFFKHYHKNITTNGRKGKKMSEKIGTVNNMPVKTETGNKMPTKTGTGNKMPMKSETGNKMPMKTETDNKMPMNY